MFLARRRNSFVPVLRGGLRLPGNWTPVLSAGISDNGARVFTTTTGDAWTKGAHSSVAYTGDVSVRMPQPGLDTVVGLSTTATSTNFFNEDVATAYAVSAVLLQARRGGAQIATSTNSPTLVNGVSYIGCRRVGSTIQFFYSLNGTGSDETVLWSNADPSAGAPLYVVAGTFHGGTTFGPVTRS